MKPKKSKIKHIKIKSSFRYPNIKESDRVFGQALTIPILREDGDWRTFLPPEEEQNKRGIESSACYIEGQQHTIATLLEEKFGIIDDNYSARFNALLSNGTEGGGDPLAGAYSINHDGLIPDSMMPFGDDIQSWEDFHSWKGVSEYACRKQGKDYLAKWKMNYKIEIEREMPLETKYTLLRAALKKSPIPISVFAWIENGGFYVKPQGARDNHMVEAVFVDEQNRIYVRDTYAPFEKILEPNYNFEFGISWTISKKPKRKSWLDIIKDFFKF